MPVIADKSGYAGKDMKAHFDYYCLGLTPVMIVRDAAGVAAQAWYADSHRRELVRDDNITIDIDDGGSSDVVSISADDFLQMCAAEGVSVPLRAFFQTAEAHDLRRMSHAYRIAVGQDFPSMSHIVASNDERLDDGVVRLPVRPLRHLRLVR